MNIVSKLFDEQFVKNLFKKQVLPLYPCFDSIEKIKIQPYKKYIWTNTYHVVIEYKVYFKNLKNNIVNISIFCSAHSEESRENVFMSLKYLWDNGFSSGNLIVPRPLFYSEEFRGIFYRGADGKNLYQYIKSDDKKEIEKNVVMSAQWFSKLHNISTNCAINFNEENSRIRTVIPGKEKIIKSIKNIYPEHFIFYNKVYDYFIKNEEEFLKYNKKRWLVHGDAHPENIIKTNDEKLCVIDFTDFCLSDFARDLGTFLQQVEFMIMRKINDQNYANKIKNLFLKKYLNNAKIKLDENLQNRINYYYYWTAIRTATFFFLKNDSEPERGEKLIKNVKANFVIN